ncbi:MAG TPA: CHRD domain-containing protein [Gemmatimonadales bacterium]|nr:CHRD domain-containing protein [Gemmatimonadales bacterium]
MRNALLAALASLFVAGTAGAQATKKPATQKAEPRHATSRETFVSVLSGGYEIPAVETAATGTTELTLDGSRLRYRVDVESMKDVTGAYIHIGRAREDQPVVADLFEGLKAGPVSGLLASGTLRANDLHGTTMRRLEQALRKDDAYVTVHTRAHPGGELRGQLRIQPVVASR